MATLCELCGATHSLIAIIQVFLKEEFLGGKGGDDLRSSTASLSWDSVAHPSSPGMNDLP